MARLESTQSQAGEGRLMTRADGTIRPASTDEGHASSMRRAPRVAIIGTRGYPSYYGGFETAVRKLAPYLVDCGWEVGVYGRSGATKMSDPSIDSRVKSIITPGLESRSLSTVTYGFSAAIHAAVRFKPDVALVMNVANGFFLPALKVRGIPTLVNVDGIEWERAKWGRLAKSMFRAGAKATARHATRLVFDAQAIERRWREEFKRDGVFIPYGGDAPGNLPTPLGLRSGEYALIVARFVPENTVPEFLDAAVKLASRHPIVIVGSTGYGGELDDRANQLAVENPNIRWLGHLSNDRLLFALLQHAGAYFHGHSVGGTNPALVQAMACGAPIVARDTIYNREVLGEDGVFVPPNVDAIELAVSSMIMNSADRDRARANARRRSAERYTWERVCHSYESELRSLLRARSL